MTPAELRQSSIRNAVISKVLYLNKSIEQFGSGFKRIDSLCREAKIKYSYELSDNDFAFTFYRRIQKISVSGNTYKMDVFLSMVEHTAVNRGLAVQHLLYSRFFFTASHSKNRPADQIIQFPAEHRRSAFNDFSGASGGKIQVFIFFLD